MTTTKPKLPPEAKAVRDELCAAMQRMHDQGIATDYFAARTLEFAVQLCLDLGGTPLADAQLEQCRRWLDHHRENLDAQWRALGN